LPDFLNAYSQAIVVDQLRFFNGQFSRLKRELSFLNLEYPTNEIGSWGERLIGNCLGFV
jgi:hypothetical protein